MSKIVNGSSLQPLSGGRPKQIVLLLHGYGSNGSDMVSFAPHWQATMPDALFLAPNAPERTGYGAGYQWWPLAAFTPQALAAGSAAAAPVIDAFIDRKLKQYDLGEEHLAIAGFSQGTMMALQVGLRRPRPLAAIVGFSGMLTGTADLTPGRIVRAPVLLVHGSDDPIVPVSALHAAERQLRRLEVPVTAHVSHGLGHSVDPVGLRLGGEFVRKALLDGGASGSAVGD
ncbi:MAG: dienelactone hydrolase family protein [Novosphingobium sp.]